VQRSAEQSRAEQMWERKCRRIENEKGEVLVPTLQPMLLSTVPSPPPFLVLLQAQTPPMVDLGF
jgi:hypothetical protein